MVLVRQEIGDVLRDFRLQKGRTLRQVASKASVALGYLSEVERGQKEASSEILASVADALDTPISTIMREVGDRLAIVEDSLPSPTRSRTTSSQSSTTTSRCAERLALNAPAGTSRRGRSASGRRRGAWRRLGWTDAGE